MEDNKLIAEFMSIKYDADDETFHTNEGWKGVDYLMYHTSWDWLMPVISKIVEDYGEGWSFEEGYDLEVRYQSVVNFIKECNDEKN
jgi:hypothetical protein